MMLAGRSKARSAGGLVDTLGLLLYENLPETHSLFSVSPRFVSC